MRVTGRPWPPALNVALALLTAAAVGRAGPPGGLPGTIIVDLAELCTAPASAPTVGAVLSAAHKNGQRAGLNPPTGLGRSSSTQR